MALTYPELAEHPRSLAGVRFPHASLTDSYQPGVTEPWVSQLVADLVVASGRTTVLELGGFQGVTSAWMALALERMGGGVLIVSEPDDTRATAIEERISALGLTQVAVRVERIPSPDIMMTLEDHSIGVAWVDDNHEHFHVAQEINHLWRKMEPGGLMLFHDVHGMTDLQREVKHFGGYALNLPRLGSAGGLGILQMP